MIVVHDIFELEPSPYRAVYLRLIGGEGTTPPALGEDPWAAAGAALRTAREIRAEGKVVPGGIRVILTWSGTGRAENEEGLLLQDPAGEWFPLRQLPEALARWGDLAAGWGPGTRRVELHVLREPGGIRVLWAAARSGEQLLIEAFRPASDPDRTRVRVERLRTRRSYGPNEEAALRAAAGEDAEHLQVHSGEQFLEGQWEVRGHTPLAVVEAVVRALVGGGP